MNSEELFRIDEKISKNGDEVVVSFGPYGSLDEIHRVAAMMFDNIPEDIGRYDGHEVNMDDTDGKLFAYGRNAEELFKLMQPMLQQFDFLNKAVIYLRFNKDDGTYSELEFSLNQVG